jgi:hypothetical protein
MDRQAITKVHAPDLGQHSHLNHLSFSLPIN